MRDPDYELRIATQIEQYAQTVNIHDLPKVFEYWHGRFLSPAVREVFGEDVYIDAFTAATDGVAGHRRVLSVGCGDGCVEIEFAKKLIERGEQDFEIVAADLSPVLLERFAAEVRKLGLETHFVFVQCDLNDLAPVTALAGTFDVIIAHHSLHHIVELEKLFDFLFDALKQTGIFATCDMIGRNGHTRWPEASAIVRCFWPLLSPKQRYHVQLKRFEEQFLDWDCSKEGFEGIRAQDILPLLIKRFHVRKFVAAGGVIDPFIDRGFGHGFDMENDHDRDLIECIARINEILLDAGVVKPTQMLAHFGKAPSRERFYRARSSQFCLRAAEPDWVRLYPDAHYVAPPPMPEETPRLLKRLRRRLRDYRARGATLLARAMSGAFSSSPTSR